MLGTNDLKRTIHGQAEGVAAGIEVLIDIVRALKASMKIMLVSPPHFTASPNHGGQPRAGRSTEESRRVAPLLEEIARRRLLRFLMLRPLRLDQQSTVSTWTGKTHAHWEWR